MSNIKNIQLKMIYVPPRRVFLPYSIHQSAGPACHARCGSSGNGSGDGGDDDNGDDGSGDGDNGGGRGGGGLWRWRQV